jgi:hypothetical protein
MYVHITVYVCSEGLTSDPITSHIECSLMKLDERSTKVVIYLGPTLIKWKNAGTLRIRVGYAIYRILDVRAQLKWSF